MSAKVATDRKENASLTIFVVIVVRGELGELEKWDVEGRFIPFLIEDSIFFLTLILPSPRSIHLFDSFPSEVEVDLFFLRGSDVELCGKS